MVKGKVYVPSVGFAPPQWVTQEVKPKRPKGKA